MKHTCVDCSWDGKPKNRNFDDEKAKPYGRDCELKNLFFTEQAALQTAQSACNVIQTEGNGYDPSQHFPFYRIL